MDHNPTNLNNVDYNQNWSTLWFSQFFFKVTKNQTDWTMAVSDKSPAQAVHCTGAQTLKYLEGGYYGYCGFFITFLY